MNVKPVRGDVTKLSTLQSPSSLGGMVGSTFLHPKKRKSEFSRLNTKRALPTQRNAMRRNSNSNSDGQARSNKAYQSIVFPILLGSHPAKAIVISWSILRIICHHQIIATTPTSHPPHLIRRLSGTDQRCPFADPVSSRLSLVLGLPSQLLNRHPRFHPVPSSLVSSRRYERMDGMVGRMDTPHHWYWPRLSQ